MYRYFWRFKLTPTGRWIVPAVLLSAVGSIDIGAPVYQVFCALIGLLMVCEPIGLVLRPHLNLKGSLPSKARVNEPCTGHVEMTNSSWKPAYDLMVGLFGLPKPIELVDGDRYISTLSRGETATLPVTLVARRRGVYRLPPIHVHSTFPFNLMRFGDCKLPTQSLTVLPNYHSLEHLDVPMSHRYQPGAALMTANVGDSMEYIGNREYTPGEPTRHLDFRAWARLGRPIVREYHEEYSCRVAVILDTFVPGRGHAQADGETGLEAAISLTASITESLSTGDLLLDFFAAGPHLHVFRSTGNQSSFDSVLEILAAVDSSRRDPFAELSPVVADEMLHISTAVCVLLDWDESRQTLMDRMLEAGCALKVVVVRNGETTLPLENSVDIKQVTVDSVVSGRLQEI